MLNIHSINLNIKSIYIYKRKRNSDDSNNQYYVIRKEKTILNEAVESEFLEIVQFLIKQKLFDIKEKLIKNKEYYDCTSTTRKYYDEKNEKSLLYLAIIKGYLGIVQLLVDIIGVNEKSISTIKEGGGCYAYQRFERIVEKSSLYYAIKNQNIKIIQWLLKHTNIDIYFGMNVIHFLYYQKKQEIFFYAFIIG